MAKGSYFRGWHPEERETQVLWDYAGKKVIFYTTNENVYKQLAKRLEGVDGVKLREDTASIEVPMKACRKPWMVLRPSKVAT